MRRTGLTRGWVYRAIIGVLAVCVVTVAVGPAGGAPSGATTDEFELEYNDFWTRSTGYPAAEAFAVSVVNGTVEFGPEASTRVRIRNADTGESVTLEANDSESTYEATAMSFNAYSLIGEATHGEVDDRRLTVKRPPGASGNQFADVDITVTGDVEMFSDETFAPYVVQILDSEGTVLAETDAVLHGVGYERPEVRYNGSAIAVERHSSVSEDWHVEIRQGFETVTEMTNAAGDEYFVASVENTDFDESWNFNVAIYQNESDEGGEQILGLPGLDVEDGAYVDGPVVGGGGSDSPLDGAAADYDADGDGTITIIELTEAATDYATGNITVGDLADVATAYAST